MKYILVNYGFTPDWIREYTDDFLIYDRSDSREYLASFPQEKIIYTENRGNVDFDKLTYLVENYDNLPDVFVWGKSNLFKYISQPEFNLVKDNTTFTPLLTQHHKTYSDQNGVVNYYSAGMYFERSDNWYLNSHFSRLGTFAEWASYFNMPCPAYIPFPPGGNFILTRETVHKYSRDFYQKMADTLPYQTLPGEAHQAERSYYLLWK